MTPADLARRLFRDQCNIGPNSSLEAYGETAAVAAMVPLIEALEQVARPYGMLDIAVTKATGGMVDEMLAVAKLARAALTPQPEEVA